MNSFAMFRLPHANRYTMVRQTEGEPLQLKALTELNGRSGFVIAPFAISDNCPILLIKPDEISEHSLPSSNNEANNDEERISHHNRDEIITEQIQYSDNFNRFYKHIECGDFKKIVLSRCSHVTSNSKRKNYETLFFDACNKYPRMTIALFHTPISGTWLMATPELLLGGNNSDWHTMALAGTMKLSNKQLAFDDNDANKGQHPHWNDKNMQEQRYVASYISKCIGNYTREFSENGPYTKRAGNLVHLCSDFSFKMEKDSHIGDLINTLHPTPAVCGIPKDATRAFIIANENTPRKYYSGFVGILSMVEQTHLYVSLRCMEITNEGYRLYAGGGLLNDSNEESEWNETESKMETMLKIL